MTPQEEKVQRRIETLEQNPEQQAKRDAIDKISLFFNVVEGNADSFSAYFGLDNEQNARMHDYFLKELNLQPDMDQPESTQDYRFNDVLKLNGTVLSRQLHVDNSGNTCGVWYVAGEMRNTLVSSQE